MGKTGGERRPFTRCDVQNRGLVLKMLQHEDALMLGETGKAIFEDSSLPHLTNLETYFFFHRRVLDAFGFSTSDSDVQQYRTIFSNYYVSPSCFDAEVLNSVCYMRENKCVYYDLPPPAIGEKAPDVELESVTGEPTSLFKELSDLNGFQHVFVAAYSNS